MVNLKTFSSNVGANCVPWLSLLRDKEADLVSGPSETRQNAKEVVDQLET